MKYIKIAFFSLCFVFFWQQVFALSQAPEGSDFYYVADIEGCKIIKYRCEEGWQYYGDSLGCGCQKEKTDIKMCNLNYDPVCGKTPEKPCMSLDCKSQEKTYPNRCSLDNDNARFLYEWECEANKELPQKTDTLYYIGDIEFCTKAKYSCEKGWQYYGDEIGCGCQKELSQKTQDHLDSTMQAFFEKMGEKNYEKEYISIVLEKLILRLQELAKQEKYKQMVEYILALIDTYRNTL